MKVAIIDSNPAVREYFKYLLTEFADVEFVENKSKLKGGSLFKKTS